MDISERLYQALKAIRGVEEMSGGLRLPQDVEVEVYINAGAELAPVVKVTEVKVDAGVWMIRNAKSDVIYFSSERVVGMKINDSGKRRGEGERAAGFTKNL
jgi:hypothetical protein